MLKHASDLAKKNFKNLKPCVHGADIYEAAGKTGLKRENILDFSSSVNPLGPSEKALKAAKNSLGQIASYPDSYATALRQAIANHYDRILPCNVAIGNGSTELIYLFADAFMRKGDVAVIPAPSFSEYENAVRKTGERIKFVKLGAGFRADATSFERAMLKKTKIVYLCNPNNPTGMLTSQDVLTNIAKKALRSDILVFLDEDFLEFVENGEELSMIRRIHEFPNLCILRSFTKIYGLTGLRIGYSIASQEVTDVLMNAKIPWNINCVAQTAAIAALEDEEHLRKTLQLVKDEKAFLLSELAKLNSLKIYPSDANFLLIDVRKTGLTAALLREKMLGHSVLIRDCSSFTSLDQYYIRVAVKTRLENEKLLAALKTTLAKKV
ncbi:MAG TPA: histidinol-phosphate transaminase [Candidatus Nanoarchaeia archaeon]|nr:histidinol-phosphate transaminase [Candidatus Nanoarchaeia archaeon]